MKIAVISPGNIPVPPKVGGSVEHCIAEITKRMAASNQVTVYSRRSPGYPAVTRKGGLRIVRLPGGRTKLYLQIVLSRIARHHVDWIQIDNRPSYVPAVRSRFPHAKISVFLHSTTFISGRVSKRSTARQLSMANMIVANSRSLAEQIVSMYPGLRGKVKFVRLGTDTNRFKPPTPTQRRAARARWGAKGSFAVVYAGRLVPKKGVPVLMKAMKRVRRSVPKAKLLIAGGAGKKAYIRKLKQLARRLRIPARFLGYISRSKMPSVYRAGDCFVCPSQGHEAFGLVNVEAMASGTPIVASNNGGIREIIRHGVTGRLVGKYRKPAAIAEQIVAVARNRKKAVMMAKRARKDVIRRFGWKSTAKRLAALYRKYAKR